MPSETKPVVSIRTEYALRVGVADPRRERARAARVAALQYQSARGPVQAVGDLESKNKLFKTCGYNVRVKWGMGASPF
ncbi:hypothetical protein MCOR07_010711 [Pyricularia oryzae]|nr:hypothetical protein MCOR32_001221 [Pyricularia oryzae]KAI6610725.1 hypothetical protein MCOR07_010711 [Pyricularia oryzae]